jgi:uncharacterized protein YcbK (DUF882 family)
MRGFCRSIREGEKVNYSISKNFSRREFACKCGCGFDAVDVELLSVLEAVRRWFSAPVTIISGCRCVAHNTKVGGAKASFHMLGKAADIKVAEKAPEEVYAFLAKAFPEKYGIGLYGAWTHIDVRRKATRWRA